MTPDRPLAPRTGWERQDWAGLADRLLLAVRPHASPSHALVQLPGPVGGNGAATDGLEGFARTMLLAGFRLAGENGDDPLNLAEWYAAGLAAGTDPSSPDDWRRPDDLAQARVEAASMALVLDLTRPWLWDHLDAVVQEQVVDYLAGMLGGNQWSTTNWLWFRVVVETFLRSVGGPWRREDVEHDLAVHDSFVREDGWLSDGHERSYDHYAGWALHLYPVLWSRMRGAEDLAAGRREADVARLDRYLLDAVRLVGADGGPLIQGRSLIYRFAAAAPLWVGAVAEVPSTPPGLLRRAASGMVGHFTSRGVPDAAGLLDLGWFSAWPALAQSYSGPGSPYWAVKGFLGLSLPATHPAWTAPEEPLPLEQGDQLFTARSPGWLVSGTQSDGLVRIINHGTDHDVEGTSNAESPLYARFAYSTATFPLLDPPAWTAPLDQAVVLLDDAGRASHRSGLTPLGTAVSGEGSDGETGPAVATGASVVEAHWVDAHDQQQHFGYGYRGTSTRAGRVRVASLVRGPWEIRLVRVEDPEPGAVRLRLGGWPVSGEGALDGAAAAGRAEARSSRLTSWLELVDTAGSEGGAAADRVTADVVRRVDAGPLGPETAVPVLELPVRADAWHAVLLGLTGRGSGTDSGTGVAPSVSLAAPSTGSLDVTVTWPDGLVSRSRVTTG